MYKLIFSANTTNVSTSIKNICISDIIDIINNIMGILLALVSIIIMVWGVSKLSEFIKQYREKRVEAVFGFYANLHFLCTQLLFHLKAGYELWGSGGAFEKYYNGKTPTPFAKANMEKLQVEVEGLLNFFKTEKNQVIPQLKPEEWNKIIWGDKAEDKKVGLYENLYDIKYNLGNRDLLLPINEYYKTITANLEKIIEIIELETNSIIKKIKKDTDN